MCQADWVLQATSIILSNPPLAEGDINIMIPQMGTVRSPGSGEVRTH